MLVLYCFISNFVRFEKRFLIFQPRTGFCSVILWSNLCALSEDKYPGEKLARNGKHRSLRIGTPRLIEASQCLTVLTLLANAFDAYCSSSSRRVARRSFYMPPYPLEWISRNSALAANRGIILRFPCFYRDNARNWMPQLFSASSSPFVLNRVGVVKQYIQMYGETYMRNNFAVFHLFVNLLMKVSYADIQCWILKRLYSS